MRPLLPPLVAGLLLSLPGAALHASAWPAAQETLWTQADADALQQAQASLQAGNARAALTTLDELAQRYPASVDLLRLRGLALLELGRDPEARAALAAALSRGALSADVLAGLLRIDFDAGRTPAVLAESRLLLVLEPENPEWALLYGDLLLQHGQAAAAEIVYTALFEREQVTPLLFERLARTAYANGRTADAVSLFESAYYLGSREPATLEALGRLWVDLGDAERADHWRRLAAGADAEGSASSANLRDAQRAWAAGDLERAERLAAGIEADGPEAERARAAELRGRVARQRGALDASLEHFRRAVAAGLEPPDVLALLGSHAFNQGAYDEAVDLLGRAWDAGRRDASLLPFLVRGAIGAGRPEEADRFLREYLERHGLDETARSLVARRAASPR